MKKVLVLVEGPTEEAFIKKVLAPSLRGLVMIPTIVKTRIIGDQPKKGGTVTYANFRRQLNLLLNDPTAALVTMMLDFQGLEGDFPGRESAPGITPKARALHVEDALHADVGNPRFLPYLALHEFEAMLFVAPEIIAAVIQERALLPGLKAIRAKYPGTPEDINDSAATSPSARIENLCKEITGSTKVFQKRAHGPVIAERIGLAQIRAECPHFNDWMNKLEAFAAS